MSIRNQNFGVERVGGTGIGSKNGQGIYTESSTAKYPIGQKLGACRRQGVSATAAPVPQLRPVCWCRRMFLLPRWLKTETSSLRRLTGLIRPLVQRSFRSRWHLSPLIKYAGALLQITDDAGEGIQYRIKATARPDANHLRQGRHLPV